TKLRTGTSGTSTVTGWLAGQRPGGFHHTGAMSQTRTCSPERRVSQKSRCVPSGRGWSLIQVVRRIQCGPSTPRAPSGLGTRAADRRRGVEAWGAVAGGADSAGGAAASRSPDAADGAEAAGSADSAGGVAAICGWDATGSVEAGAAGATGRVSSAG